MSNRAKRRNNPYSPAPWAVGRKKRRSKAQHESSGPARTWWEVGIGKAARKVTV